MSAKAPHFSAGQKIDERYELRTTLGIGGFGEVWMALDPAGTPVALKILHSVHRNEERIRKRFSREAKLLSKLDHPGIPRAVDWRCDAEEAYIALEYVEGVTLARRLLRMGVEASPAALRPLLAVFRATCEAAHYAHQSGVIHRDLKPPNIMIVREQPAPSIRILDFGIAKILDTDRSDATTKGRVLGTHNYLSPEQLSAKETTTRVDIFALGTILFEILTLHRTWLVDHAGERLRLWEKGSAGPNEVMDVVGRVIRGARPSVTKLRPSFPEAIDDVVARALAMEPKDRQESTLQLADEVDRAMASWLESTVAGSAEGELPSFSMPQRDEQWGIETKSDAMGAAPDATDEPLNDPTATRVLTEVYPTDLEAPSEERSLSSSARSMVDSIFRKARAIEEVRASESKRRRWAHAFGRGILMALFAVGVGSGALQVLDWAGVSARPKAPPPAEPKLGVVPGTPRPNALDEDTPSAKKPARRTRSRAAARTDADAPAEASPAPARRPSSVVEHQLRHYYQRAENAQVDTPGRMRHLKLAVAIVKRLAQQHLTPQETRRVSAAADAAARSGDLSKLERAIELYEFFRQRATSAVEPAEPL